MVAEQSVEMANAMATMAAAIQSLQASLTSGGGGGRGDREEGEEGGGGKGATGRIIDKAFMLMTSFGNSEEEWNEYAKDFKSCVGSCCLKMVEAMNKVEKQENPITVEYIEENEGEDWKGIKKRSGELYHILRMNLSGEAKVIIEEADGDGVRAWQLLAKAYSKRTLAKTLRKYKEVMSPGVAKGTDEVIQRLITWEAKVKDLEKEEGMQLNNMVKLAGMTEICTQEIQDHIFQSIKESSTYREVKDQIVTWISNRAAATNGGKYVNNCECPEEEWDQHQHETEIDLICHGCGGHGHPIRLCPTPKGKGKSQNTFGGGKANGGKGDFGKNNGGWNNSKGYGKGYQQNWQPAQNQSNWNQGPKGFGKGYQGKCDNCGEIGHKWRECQKPVNPTKGKGKGQWTFSVEQQAWVEGTGVAPKEVGSCWTIGNVCIDSDGAEDDMRCGMCGMGEEAEEWTEVKKKGRRLPKRDRERGTSKRAPAPRGSSVDVNRVATGSGHKYLASSDNRHGTHATSKTCKIEDESQEEAKRHGTHATSKTCQIEDEIHATGQTCQSNEEVMEKMIMMAEKAEEALCQMTFHVTDAKKMLASVSQIVKAGNVVHFEEGPVGSYIQCKRTGRITYLKMKNGLYILEVAFQNGDQWVEGAIVIDSGAAGNVMPQGVLEKILALEDKNGTKFVGADGKPLGNYGIKTVRFVPQPNEVFTGRV